MLDKSDGNARRDGYPVRGNQENRYGWLIGVHLSFRRQVDSSCVLGRVHPFQCDFGIGFVVLDDLRGPGTQSITPELAESVKFRRFGHDAGNGCPRPRFRQGGISRRAQAGTSTDGRHQDPAVDPTTGKGALAMKTRSTRQGDGDRTPKRLKIFQAAIPKMSSHR